jgi:hypothetical protein
MEGPARRRFRRLVREADRERKKQDGQDGQDTPRGPAIHGDIKGPGRRLYNGYDHGLGCEVHGRSDRRRKMVEIGLKHWGERLVEAG